MTPAIMRTVAHLVLVSAVMLSFVTIVGCGGAKEARDRAIQQGEEAYDKNDFDLAIRCYTEAIRLDPKYAKAYYNRGVTYDAKGDKVSAQKDFEMARRLKSQ